MKILVALFARLPLPVNHRIGALLGRLAWRVSPRFKRMLAANIRVYAKARGLDAKAVRKLEGQAKRESGKGMTELAVVWTAPVERLYAMVKSCDGWEHVDAATAAGRGIIFVTPHLGCYDIAGRYLESRLPVMALFRPPKLKWLEPIMQAGRERGEGKTAEANAGGVRALLRTLKSGGNIIILPDQVPAAEQGGEGVWASFFGEPAYTMTLLPRLARSTGAAALFFFAERLADGAGYHVHIRPAEPVFPDDKSAAATQANRAVEALIDMAPAQYLWSYNRYKHPAGAPLPPRD
ncbi:MAG: lysophospholipid acyltransferase family protein [Betaproteobacteria bacterium]|nr:lysophospholipid acyltransferase family protein [Betaproteobacteria bacterium]